MKQLIFIVLLCLPMELSAAERCSSSRASRDEVARIVTPRPAAGRAVMPRTQKIRLPATWQRAFLVEQQIL